MLDPFMRYRRWGIGGMLLLGLGAGIWWYANRQAPSHEGWQSLNAQVEVLLAEEKYDTVSPGSSKAPGSPKPSATKLVSPAPTPAGTALGTVSTPAPVSSSAPPSNMASIEAPKQALIDLNHANLSLLTELPNIGPSKAQAIIAYREAKGGFKEIAEIMKVKGIGPKTYEKLKDRITVSPQ